MENMLYPDKNAAIFEELQLNCLTVKNRLLRSSISGRIDNYNGSGTPARVKFEEMFAQGGDRFRVAIKYRIAAPTRLYAEKK